jgi:hypothetical protein
VVVGSPRTLSTDRIWRSWIRWVRDNGAFAVANSLPLCPWEDAADAFLADLDVSELAPVPVSDVEDDAPGPDVPEAAASGGDWGVGDGLDYGDGARWSTPSEVGRSGAGQLGAALQGVADALVLPEGQAGNGEGSAEFAEP